jgi:hypothetical protein
MDVPKPEDLTECPDNDKELSRDSYLSPTFFRHGEDCSPMGDLMLIRQLAHRDFFEPVEGRFRGLGADHRQYRSNPDFWGNFGLRKGSDKPTGAMKMGWPWMSALPWNRQGRPARESSGGDNPASCELSPSTSDVSSTASTAFGSLQAINENRTAEALCQSSAG